MPFPVFVPPLFFLSSFFVRRCFFFRLLFRWEEKLEEGGFEFGLREYVVGLSCIDKRLEIENWRVFIIIVWGSNIIGRKLKYVIIV